VGTGLAFQFFGEFFVGLSGDFMAVGQKKRIADTFETNGCIPVKQSS
jgi:hypothetical protein